MSTPLRGRQAEAMRNDERILQAAREVFLADPNATVAAVAERAGVGIGALYRRYRNKEDLIRKLAADGLDRYIAGAEAALADGVDPWAAFAAFMRRSLDAGANALSLHFAGSFTSSDELNEAGRRGYELTQEIIQRARDAGVLRPDIEVGDLHMIFEQLQSINLGDPERTHQLRHRYLALILDALRTPEPSSLPGPAPSWTEMRDRYDG